LEIDKRILELISKSKYYHKPIVRHSGLSGLRLIENLSLFSEGFPTRFACGNDSFKARPYFEIGSSIIGIKIMFERYSYG
jgi:hypothetical protein